MYSVEFQKEAYIVKEYIAQHLSVVYEVALQEGQTVADLLTERTLLQEQLQPAGNCRRKNEDSVYLYPIQTYKELMSL